MSASRAAFLDRLSRASVASSTGDRWSSDSSASAEKDTEDKELATLTRSMGFYAQGSIGIESVMAALNAIQAKSVDAAIDALISEYDGVHSKNIESSQSILSEATLSLSAGVDQLDSIEQMNLDIERCRSVLHASGNGAGIENQVQTALERLEQSRKARDSTHEIVSRRTNQIAAIHQILQGTASRLIVDNPS